MARWPRRPLLAEPPPSDRGRASERPLFTWVYPRVAALMDRRGAAAEARRLLHELSGEILELGAGSGRIFAHYPREVTWVVAVEPSRRLRELAEMAASADPRIRVVAGVAEEIPAPDASFDAVVTSLVLCSVSDLHRVAGEIRRVLRPGGEVRIHEHVVSGSRPLATMERWVTPVWARTSGGCHLDRDPISALEQAGIHFTEMRRFAFAPLPLLPAVAHVTATGRIR